MTYTDQLYIETMSKYIEQGLEIIEFLNDLNRSLENEKAQNSNDYRLYFSHYDSARRKVIVNDEAEMYSLYGEIDKDLSVVCSELSKHFVADKYIIIDDATSSIMIASLILGSLIDRNYSKIDIESLYKTEDELIAFSVKINDLLKKYYTIKNRIKKGNNVVIFNFHLQDKNFEVEAIMKEFNLFFKLISRFNSDRSFETQLLSIQYGSWEYVYSVAAPIVTMCVLLDKYILDRKKKQLEIQKMYLEIQKMNESDFSTIEKSLKEKFVIDSKALSRNIFDSFKNVIWNNSTHPEKISFLKKAIGIFVGIFVNKKTTIELINSPEQGNDNLLYDAFVEQQNLYDEILELDNDNKDVVLKQPDFKLLE